MHTLRHGPKILVINTKKLNKPKETKLKKLESFKAPKVILSIKTWAEEFVDAH